MRHPRGDARSRCCRTCPAPRTGSSASPRSGDPAEIPFGRLTLQVIRAELARIVAQRAASDPHLYYLDGLTLYGAADAVDLPLPDDLHPTPRPTS